MSAEAGCRVPDTGVWVHCGARGGGAREFAHTIREPLLGPSCMEVSGNKRPKSRTLLVRLVRRSLASACPQQKCLLISYKRETTPRKEIEKERERGRLQNGHLLLQIEAPS